MHDAEALLNDITFMALDHGINSIEDNSDPLIPFTLTESDNGEKKLERFVTEKIEEGVEAAKKHVNSLREGTIRYAIAWDGFITLENKKWDAVFVESGDNVQKEGLLMFQRYERKGFFRKKNVPVGNPALVEKPLSRLNNGESGGRELTD